MFIPQAECLDVYSLEQLGFSGFFAAQAAEFSTQGWIPARVSAASQSRFHLLGCEVQLAELSGRLRHELSGPQRPNTGDWVMLEVQGERATIQRVLPRRTALVRRAVRGGGEQLVAANVDVFFIVTSANEDFSPRRLERYVTAVWDSGARPVVALNKVDLTPDPGEYVRAVESACPGVDVLCLSALDGTGIEALESVLAPGLTFGFVGSSGVGKSSLVNRLQGHETQITLQIRDDGTGRHATTRRELIPLSNGSVLVDTPGMREFGVVADEASLDAAFADIAELGASCHFQDCKHESEPGCAVLAAEQSGELPSERLQSYRKLLRETAAFERRQSPEQMSNAKRRWKSIHKQMRSFDKSKRYR
ncbi:MAG: ribosome small subunit-dependent GTPase A [Polyangiaceae bacterium]